MHPLTDILSQIESRYGGPPIAIGYVLITPPHTSNEIWTLVQVDIQSNYDL